MDLSKEPTRSWIHHAPAAEQEISLVIWQIMRAHYPGAIDPLNPSLMAQRLFAISRSIYNDLEVRVEANTQELFAQCDRKIAELEAEIRQLKGLPPLPPMAIA